MKILLYGENWENTHVNVIARVLTERGFDCKIFDFFSLLSYQTGSDFANRVLRRLFYQRNETIINKLLLKEIEIFTPDVLLISKGVNIYPETLQSFKKRSIMILNWNPDDFFNPYNSSKHLQASLSLYDYVFSARKHLFNEYKTAGIKNPVFLEWYYIPWVNKKPDIVGIPQKKITFIGSYSKRRESIIHSIDEVYPVEIWGGGWGLSKLRYKRNTDIKNRILPLNDFPEIVSGSLINLNILTIENKDMTNLKIFEIPSCYGLLLTEYKSSSEEILLDGSFYYSPESGYELNNTIEFIFKTENAELISRIIEKGYTQIVNDHHSIYNRVDTLLQTINV